MGERRPLRFCPGSPTGGTFPVLRGCVGPFIFICLAFNGRLIPHRQSDSSESRDVSMKMRALFTLILTFFDSTPMVLGDGFAR